jgi:hypothetical protein
MYGLLRIILTVGYSVRTGTRNINLRLAIQENNVNFQDVFLTVHVAYSVNHHHRLDSPTWALAFLRSFCQLKYPAIALQTS